MDDDRVKEMEGESGRQSFGWERLGYRELLEVGRLSRAAGSPAWPEEKRSRPVPLAKQETLSMLLLQRASYQEPPRICVFI